MSRRACSNSLPRTLPPARSPTRSRRAPVPEKMKRQAITPLAIVARAITVIIDHTFAGSVRRLHDHDDCNGPAEAHEEVEVRSIRPHRVETNSRHGFQYAVFPHRGLLFPKNTSR